MALSGKDFQILVEVSERSHVLKDSEQKLLQSVFDFTETTVKEIMIPRVDMVALDVRVPPKAAIDLIQKDRYSRVPIYENDLDHIIGILYAKDLIPYLRRMNELVSLRTIARPVYLVPESKMIDELLQEFQKKNIHLAIVVDEFGGTAGLVTLEDILEELVGDIEGEPVISTELIKPLPEGTYQLDPRIPLDDFNEKFHAFLKKDEGFETLSGYLLYRLGRLPKENEPIRAGRFCFRVTRIEGPRILEIQMELRKPLHKSSQTIDQ
jgi:CBS domain containing-hemolysin-like protein